jgi:formylglycine-generating enzyme required for sulfatase activity
MEFCRWLSRTTGEKFTLPDEAQWEYACRAGSNTAFWFGDQDSDFSRFANLADASLSNYPRGNSPDWMPKDARFNDGQVVTAKVGSYLPNPWGLCDMSGNAAEWTLSNYAPYPYIGDDGRNDGSPDKDKVVRGGSWYDRPYRSTSAYRVTYPAWQKVFDVGFRVICEDRGADTRMAASPEKP